MEFKVWVYTKWGVLFLWQNRYILIEFLFCFIFLILLDNRSIFGLISLQSWCCKPPTICGYQYVNPTMWINPVNTIVDPDCAMWNNDQTQLCYNCDSCQAGMLGNLIKDWRRTNVILIIALVVLIWVYVIACSAFKNA